MSYRLWLTKIKGSLLQLIEIRFSTRLSNQRQGRTTQNLKTTKNLLKATNRHKYTLMEMLLSDVFCLVNYFISLL